MGQNAGPENPSQRNDRGLHTRGPLEAAGRFVRAEVGKSGYRGRGFDIAQTLGSVGDTEADANARLYAAAPDYYDAAESIRQYVVTTELVGRGNPLCLPLHMVQALLRAHKKADPVGYRTSPLAAAVVNKPAEPPKFSRDAGHNELHTDLAAPPVPTDDHAACDNAGSLQHTPTTWIGNEQVNREVGGGR